MTGSLPRYGTVYKWLKANGTIGIFIPFMRQSNPLSPVNLSGNVLVPLVPKKILKYKRQIFVQTSLFFQQIGAEVKPITVIVARPDEAAGELKIGAGFRELREESPQDALLKC
jgi:hypothetical protein